ncbi:MAG: lysophospholipid acyltransferase family protein [Candidatus Saelkia tenebricola]|nr:lysophospholipid acyltransferase family protein [Candidatus Saelkia tenebricola]
MFKIFWSSLYMVAICLVRILPRSVAIEIGYLTSIIYYFLDKKSNSVIRDNLKQILKDNFKERYVRVVFRNFAFYLVDFMRVKNNNDSFLKRYLTIEDKNILDNVFETSEKGVVVLSMHLGNWEITGGYLSYLGYPVSAVAMDHVIGFVDRFFKLQRKRLGIEELPFRNSLNTCQLKLKQKGVLGLLCDRDFTGNFISSTLFGKKYYLPKAPFLISLRTKSPLVLVVTVRDGYRYKMIIKGPFFYKTFNLKEMWLIVEEVVSVMEGVIKEYPQQWFLFQRFWEKPQDVVIL